MLSAQGVQVQPLEVDDFSGGMTDNILGAPSNKFERADNFYLKRVGNKARLFTRPALRVYTTARIATNTRINKIFDIEEKLFQISNKKIYQNTTSAFTEVTGVGANPPFNAGSSTSQYSLSTWQKHAIIANDSFSKITKLFNNGTNWIVHNLGLPSISSSNATLTPSSTTTPALYSYAFHYTYQYTNQGVTFEEEGAIKFQTVSSTAITTNTITITPHASWTLSNGSTTNYDLSNLKIKIYRTQANGTVYYYLTTVNHTFTSYVDNTTDSAIAIQTPLYTNGADDYPMHAEPPPAKFAHIVNDVLVLGYVTENSQNIPNKLRFSNRFSPWSCPEDFYDEVDEEIVGINSVSIYPIVFCKNKIYRVEGYYLPDGSGGVTKKLLSSTAGCMSNGSIVKTDTGLFWCGNDGWYFTDGYNVTRISADLLNSYLDLITTTNQRTRIQGVYYPKLQTIMWAMQASDVNTDNDIIFMTYLQAGVSDNMPFTTWSAGDGTTNFMPTCLHHVNGMLYHADTNGYLMKYDEDLFSDHKIDTAVAPASWVTKTLIYLYRSISFNFGSSSMKKWVTKILLNAENTSALSLIIRSNNDNSGSFKDLKEINYSGNVAWGDSVIDWGEDYRWNYFPTIAVKRGFPKSSLRCFYKQIEMTNSYTELYNSTEFSQAVINGSTNQATLVTGSWPTDIRDYYLSTSADGYITQFKILIDGTTITVDDSLNTLPTGTYDWKIQGYRRDEIVRIVSYAINYSFTQQSAEPYRGTA